MTIKAQTGPGNAADYPSCKEGGTRHRVDDAALKAVEETVEGGTVVCLDCGKELERGGKRIEGD